MEEILVEEFEDDEMGNPLMSRPSLLPVPEQSLPGTDPRPRANTLRGKTPLQKAKPELLTWLRCLLAANTQISFVLILMAAVFGYITSMSNRLVKHDDNWMTCFVRLGRFKRQTDLTFVEAASAYGCQVAVFSNIAIATTTHALHHTALLPSVIPMVVYDLLCILSYFSLQHVTPFPTQLEATLLSMTKYVHPSMYDSLGLGETCDSAVRFAMAFVALCYASLFIVTCVFCIAVYGNYLRKKALPAARVATLHKTIWPNRLARIVFLGYIIQLVGKAGSSILGIDTFQKTLAPTYYPAATTTLDPTTIFLVVANMAVIRGTLARSSSAFRLGAASTIMYLATTWPGMVAAVTLFSTYNLFTDHGCLHAFEGSVKFGIPDKHETLLFCAYSRASFVGEMVIFAAMHAQLVACTMCFMRNRKRGLGLFNTSAPDNAQYLLHSGLGHIHSVEPASGGTGLGSANGVYADAAKTGFE